MSSSNDDVTSILQQIMTVSQGIIDSLGLPERTPVALPPNAESLIPPINLQFPSNLFAPIHALALPSHVETPIIERISYSFGELQDKYRETYRNTCFKIMSSGMPDYLDIMQRLPQVYATKFKNAIEEQVRNSVTQIQNRLADGSA